MSLHPVSRRLWTLVLGVGVFVLAVTGLPAQQWVTETRDPKQTQDEDFAKAYAEWTGEARFGSPLVDHLPKVAGIPMPKDVIGYHVGAPRKLTYYDNLLKYYRALEKASPRVKVESIGKSDEGRDLVVVWISSEANIKNLQQNRDNLARIADPRGLGEPAIKQLIATTRPHYHLMGGLHSGETGPSEMLMELAYRLTAETSPVINQIRDNVYVSITPVADADGRDRNVDNFYCNQDLPPAAGGGGRAGGAAAPAAGETGAATPAAAAAPPAAAAPAPTAPPAPAPGSTGPQALGVTFGCALPYWGKYVYHDNNRDINLSQVSMRALADWYFTAHPPIMHDLHESLSLMYTYSGGAPQNPNLDPLLFAELPFFSNWEMAQMTKWGMPGVYTHAFMDGWSPGYLGSLAYNHNGLMKMYETQSGRDGGPGAGGRGAAGGGRGAAGAAAPGAAPAPAAGGGAAGGRGGRGGRGADPATTAAGDPGAAAAGAGGRGAGADATQAGARAGAPAPGRGGAPVAGAPAGGGRAGAVPTGRGGGQDREWYRGIPVPPNAAASFTRRNNTNYMQTGVLSSLQLTSMFPNLIVENFYVKTRNSIEQGKTTAPFGYVIAAQPDMTKAAELVRILRVQGIEVGQTRAEIKLGDATFGAGSYVIKGGQPYWRLAKNLLEKQNYPDPALRTYDDSGWSMGYAFNVDVKEIADKAVLDVAAPLVKAPEVAGRITGSGNAGLAVGHFGSNNMIAFRYKLRNVPMKVAEKSFTVDGTEFPAGSFILTGAVTPEIRAAVTQYGLTAAAFGTLPTVAAHEADAPRVAIYSNWSGTQELGWYRHAFDQFGIPFELIYKERVKRGNLKADFDVVIMAAQNVARTSVLAPSAARPSAYMKNDKYKFMGMYGESADTTGGFGQEGVDAFAKFLEAGGTLITTDSAVRFPIEFGFARSVDTETVTGVNAQKPLVQAEIAKTGSSIFYGYANQIIPVKYAASQSFFRVGPADQDKIIARFVGGDAAVLSGLMTGGDAIRQRAFVVDLPEAYRGKGRVVMFANNPIYRWQNHGEFNMVFNTIINWNDQ